MRYHPMSVVSPNTVDRAFATLTDAFADNVAERWLYPDDGDYAKHFPEFLSAVADGALAAHTAWQSNDFGAVALLLGPGVEADAERIGTVLRASVAKEKHHDMFDSLEQMDDAHPRYPHWYLPWVGVAPAKQRQGLGTELLTSCLEYIDVSGLPVFLETPSPRSIPFFERLGFAVTGQVAAGDYPPIAIMLRPGRSSVA